MRPAAKARAAAILAESTCERPAATSHLRHVASCRRHQCRPPGQSVQRHHGRGGYFFSVAARLDHRASRRQRRRQDHHHRHDHGADGAHFGHRFRSGRADAAAALSGVASDEFRKSLCRHADAADRAAEPEGFRRALWRRGRGCAHRSAGGGIRSDRISSTAPPANCRPDRRRASRSPNLCSIIPRCCCSTSRPHRSIQIPRIGCADGLNAIAPKAALPFCLPPTI